MAEQLLDDAQVGAALEEMRRERVAQGVRADPVVEAGAGAPRLDRGPRLLPGEAATAVAQEQRPAARRRDMRQRQQPGRGPSIQARASRAPRRRPGRAVPCRPCR